MPSTSRSRSSANGTDDAATCWLMSTDGGTTYNYLAYAQTISMQFTIGMAHYTFPHVTSNVVTRVSS